MKWTSTFPSEHRRACSCVMLLFACPAKVARRRSSQPSTSVDSRVYFENTSVSAASQKV